MGIEKYFRITFFFLYLCCIFLLQSYSAIHYISSGAELLALQYPNTWPGDIIVLSEGTYNNEYFLFWSYGTPAKPVTLMAETPGKVLLTGTSQVEMCGSNLVVKGLYFTNISVTSKHALTFRKMTGLGGQMHAYNSRVTECAFINCNGGLDWIAMYGWSNRVDHCSFRYKDDTGPMLVVWFSESGWPTLDPIGHRIDHNYFSDRSGSEDNGLEVMRIGDSEYSLSNYECTIEYNYISNVESNEPEIISSKSCGNVYRYNTFRACTGTLTLRHGRRCLVEGNFFFGDGMHDSGGVRVIGEDHTVINNYFQDLQGELYRSALVVMNGDASPPLNGYAHCTNALIAFNTFVNNYETFNIGFDKSANGGLPTPVRDGTIANNLVLATGRPIFRWDSYNNDVNAENMIYEGNIVFGGSYGTNPGGTIWADPLISDVGDVVWRLDGNSPASNAAVGSYPIVSNDFELQGRIDGFKDVGADEFSESSQLARPLYHEETGPLWYWGYLRPEDPSGLTLTPISISEITLEWIDNSTNEWGFRIYRSLSNIKPATPVHITGADIETWTDTGLVENTVYYYWVESYNKGGSRLDITGNASTLLALPAAPSNLALNPVDFNRIDISWTDNSWNEEGFKIYRSIVNSKPGAPVHVTGQDVESWSDLNVFGGATYYYWIEAYNSTGESPDIFGFTVTPVGPPAVIAHVPADEESGISDTTRQILIIFNSNMDGISVGGAANISGPGATGLNYMIGDGSESILLEIAGDLQYGGKYIVTIDTSAQTSDGASLPSNYSFSFWCGVPGLYVHAQGGNDTNSGTAYAPFQTIERAIQEMQNTNIIAVAYCAGTFPNQTFATYPGGTPARPFKFTAWSNSQPPRIDCGGERGFDFNGANAVYYIIEKFYFYGSVNGSGVHVRNGSTGIEIIECTFDSLVSASRGIYFEGGENAANSNILYNCTGSDGGIYFKTGSIKNNIVIGNVIYGQAGRGIRFAAGFDNVLIRNNTIVNSFSYGIESDGCLNQVFHNNIFVGCGNNAIDVTSGTGCTGDYNCFSNMSGFNYYHVNGDEENNYRPGDLVNIDPVFASLTFGNIDYLHLEGGSPCIDAGNPIYPPPVGGGAIIDIGAYEWGIDITPPEVTITSGPDHSVTTNNPFTVEFTTDENYGYLVIDGAGPYSFSGSTNVYVTNTSTILYYGEDLYFNTSAVKSVAYFFGSPSPIVQIVTGPASDITTNQDFAVTLTVDKNWGYWSTNGAAGPYTQFDTNGSSINVADTTTLFYYGDDGSYAGATNHVVYTFDLIPPVVSIISGPASNCLTNLSFSITLSVSEDFGYWSTNSSVDSQFDTTTVIWISNTTSLTFYGKDGLGNTSSTNTIIYVFDVAPPDITIISGPPGNVSNTNLPFAISLQTTEDFGYYSIDGVVFYQFSGITNIYIPVETPGIWYYGKDAFGNTGITNHNVYTWDVSYPVVTVIPDSLITNQSFPAFLSVNKDWGYWSTNGITGPYLQFDTNGANLNINENTILYYFGSDGVNTSPTNSNVYVLDSSAPSVSIIAGPTNNIYTNEPFVVTLGVTEDFGYWSTNGITFLPFSTNLTIDIISSINLLFYGRDSINNTSPTNMVVYTIDTTPPAVFISSGPSSNVVTNEGFVINIDTTDDFGYVSTNGNDFSAFRTNTNINILPTTTGIWYFGRDYLGNTSFTNHHFYYFYPRAPSSLAIDFITTNSVGIHWTDNSIIESNYIVYWGETTLLSDATNKIILSADTTNLIISNLGNNNDYYFWVAASNSNGASVSTMLLVYNGRPDLQVTSPDDHQIVYDDFNITGYVNDFIGLSNLTITIWNEYGYTNITDHHLIPDGTLWEFAVDTSAGTNWVNGKYYIYVSAVNVAGFSNNIGPIVFQIENLEFKPLIGPNPLYTKNTPELLISGISWESEVKIYTVDGTLIKEYLDMEEVFQNLNNTCGVLLWDLKNMDGNDVGTGLYILKIRKNKVSDFGIYKISIIRR